MDNLTSETEVRDLREQVADLEKRVRAREEENAKREQILKKLGAQEAEVEKELMEKQRQIKKKGILKNLKSEEPGYNFVLPPNTGPKKVILQAGKNKE
jgi:dynactin complex subunit